ncbi:MAG: biopolymer transporter ExbD [Candidatus Aminicenantes bacterium]|nr:biopolymer transporter ExbD [Candidatus Aminicenantes bacterium]
MSVSSEPNVVPLCDILLVLLIIFMVITPLSQKGMDIILPETSSESGATPVGLVVMTLLTDLSVDINKSPYAFDQVGDELRRIYSARQDKTIFIRAYAKVPFYKVIELIDIAKGAGVDTTGLIPEYIEDVEIIGN